MTEKKHDPVNHPSHYTSHPSGVEVLALTREMPFGPGNAVKYVLRRDLKGDPVEDIDKAIFYLNDAIKQGLDYFINEKLNLEGTKVMLAETDPLLAEFIEVLCVHDATGLPTAKANVSTRQLMHARALARLLRAEYTR